MSAYEREASPAWLFDEHANAGRENLDATHVSLYDHKEDAEAALEVMRLTRMGLNQDSIVLDIGAGTGQFTTAVAPKCAQVIAVDISPVMLDNLRRKLDLHSLNNVTVVEAGFLSYLHTGAPADFVYSRFAMHHLPDFWKAIAFSRLFAMMRPGAVLRLWDVVYHCAPAEAPRVLVQWCDSLDSTDPDGWQREDIEEHVRDEHSTFTWLLEAMAQRAGFEIEDAEYSEDGVMAQYVMRKPTEKPTSGSDR